MLMEVQKVTQCTCQAKGAVESSFTLGVALLVHPSGTIHPTVDLYGFKRS